MRGLFPVCCADANVQSAKSMAQSVRPMILLVMMFVYCLMPTACCLFDHLIRPLEHADSPAYNHRARGRCFLVTSAIKSDKLTNRTDKPP